MNFEAHPAFARLDEEIPITIVDGYLVTSDTKREDHVWWVYGPDSFLRGSLRASCSGPTRMLRDHLLRGGILQSTLTAITNIYRLAH